MTQGQAKALKLHYKEFVNSKPLILTSASERSSGQEKLGVEVGFGMGDALVSWAKTCPQWNLVGIDVYRPGIGALLNKIVDESLSNVKVLEMDARLAFDECFAPTSVDEVRIFFPDPWPKKKHHKRRLIQPEFVLAVANALKASGQLLIATDWSDYADQIETVIESSGKFMRLDSNTAVTNDDLRPLTRFEIRGMKLGHTVRDLAYQRNR